MLVKLAGKDLGASAIGIIYSVEYLLLSGLIPFNTYITSLNIRGGGYLFLAMNILSGIMCLFVIIKWIKW